MSARDLPPLDDDLSELLDAERGAAGPPHAARERVFEALTARIGATYGLGPSPGASAGVARAASIARRAWPLLCAFVLGGGVTALTLGRTPARVVETIVYVDRPAPPAPLTSVSASASSTPPSPAPVPPTARPASAATPRSQGDPLAAERALLDVARDALASGDADRALAAVERHRREFSAGVLAEEREALAVKGLVMAGRYAEARARGERFRARYPQSVMLRAVESSLASAP